MAGVVKFRASSIVVPGVGLTVPPCLRISVAVAPPARSKGLALRPLKMPENP